MDISGAPNTGLDPYQLKPPAWRPPLRDGVSDPICPDFYKPRPGQPEDALTGESVQRGYYYKPFLSHNEERYSNHGDFYKQLNKDDIVRNRLSILIGKVLESQPGPSSRPSFRLPPRVTLNDQKRESWINDLANPAVPLQRLSKAVSHGYKGEKLLEMLETKMIPVRRAVWYIRAIGGIELQAQRTRPNFSSQSHTDDWTKVVTDYLSRHMKELEPSPVSTPSRSTFAQTKPTIQAKVRLRNILAEKEVGRKWTSQFRTSLVKQLFYENLLSRHKFLTWSVEQLRLRSLAPLNFVLVIISDYINHILCDVSLGRTLVDVCFQRLLEVSRQNITALPSLVELSTALKRLLQQCFSSSPQLFVYPPLWLSPEIRMQKILAELPEYAAVSVFNSPSPDIKISQACDMQISSVLKRVDRLFYPPGSKRHESISKNAEIRSYVNTLDDIKFGCEMSTVFHNFLRLPGNIDIKIDALLSWCICTNRAEEFRRYATAQILLQYAQQGDGLDGRVNEVLAPFLGDKKFSSPSSQPTTSNTGKLQKELVDWIYRADEQIANRKSFWPNVAQLFAEFMRVGLFSYGKYLQAMIASGNISPSMHNRYAEQNTTLVTYLLQYLPVSGESKAIKFQSHAIRRASSVNVHLNFSATKIKSAKDAIRRLLPKLFDEEPDDQPVNTMKSDDFSANSFSHDQQNIFDTLPEKDNVPLFSVQTDDKMSLLNSVLTALETPEEKYCISVLWFLPHLTTLVEQMKKQTSDLSNTYLFKRDYLALCAHIFRNLNDYYSFLKFIMLALELPAKEKYLNLIADMVRSDLDVWAAMDVLPIIAAAIGYAHDSLRSRNQWSRPVINLLNRLDEAGLLNEQTKSNVQLDYQSLCESLNIYARNNPTVSPSNFPEIRSMAIDAPRSHAANIANSLWYKYHPNDRWDSTAWADTIATESAFATEFESSLISRPLKEDACANFVLELNNRLPNGLGSTIIRWLTDNEIAIASPESTLHPVAIARLLLCGVIEDFLPVQVVLQSFISRQLMKISRIATQDNLQLHANTENLFHVLLSLLSILLLPDEKNCELRENASCRAITSPLDQNDLEHLIARRNLSFSVSLFEGILHTLAAVTICEHTLCTVNKNSIATTGVEENGTDNASKMNKMIESIRQVRNQLVNQPTFRAAFLRDPQKSMHHFLKTDGADDVLKGRLLDVVLDALKNASYETEQIESCWDNKEQNDNVELSSSADDINFLDPKIWQVSRTQAELRILVERAGLQKIDENISSPDDHLQCFGQPFMQRLLLHADANIYDGLSGSFSEAGRQRLACAGFECLLNNLKSYESDLSQLNYHILRSTTSGLKELFRRILASVDQPGLSLYLPDTTKLKFLESWTNTFLNSKDDIITTANMKKFLGVASSTLCLAMRCQDLWTITEGSTGLLRKTVEYCLKVFAAYLLRNDCPNLSFCEQLYDLILYLASHDSQHNQPNLPGAWTNALEQASSVTYRNVNYYACKEELANFRKLFYSPDPMPLNFFRAVIDKSVPKCYDDVSKLTGVTMIQSWDLIEFADLTPAGSLNKQLAGPAEFSLLPLNVKRVSRWPRSSSLFNSTEVSTSTLLPGSTPSSASASSFSAADSTAQSSPIVASFFPISIQPQSFGTQKIVDSEIPVMQETLMARDFRRTLCKSPFHPIERSSVPSWGDAVVAQGFNSTSSTVTGESNSNYQSPAVSVASSTINTAGPSSLQETSRVAGITSKPVMSSKNENSGNKRKAQYSVDKDEEILVLDDTPPGDRMTAANNNNRTQANKGKNLITSNPPKKPRTSYSSRPAEKAKLGTAIPAGQRKLL